MDPGEPGLPLLPPALPSTSYLGHLRAGPAGGAVVGRCSCAWGVATGHWVPPKPTLRHCRMTCSERLEGAVGFARCGSMLPVLPAGNLPWKQGGQHLTVIFPLVGPSALPAPLPSLSNQHGCAKAQLPWASLAFVHRRERPREAAGQRPGLRATAGVCVYGTKTGLRNTTGPRSIHLRPSVLLGCTKVHRRRNPRLTAQEGGREGGNQQVGPGVSAAALVSKVLERIVLGFPYEEFPASANSDREMISRCWAVSLLFPKARAALKLTRMPHHPSI